jgi:copper homeostasis protein CutC
MRKFILFFSMALFVAFGAYAQPRPTIKQADLSDKDIAEIQKILKGVDASLFSLSIEQNGKVTRLGSATMRNLSTVSAYHKPGSQPSAANEILTTVGNYVKTVWTSAFEKAHPDKVKQINQILEASASRVERVMVKPDVKATNLKPSIRQANFTNNELDQIQQILKGTDASTYNISIEQDGKATRLGSADIRGLSTVSAFHKAGGKASAANEIVTTVGNYVKTVWTSAFEKMYPDKVKQINQIMESAATRR